MGGAMCEGVWVMCAQDSRCCTAVARGSTVGDALLKYLLSWGRGENKGIKMLLTAAEYDKACGCVCFLLIIRGVPRYVMAGRLHFSWYR